MGLLSYLRKKRESDNRESSKLGLTTVTIYDDDRRVLNAYPHCTAVGCDGWQICFQDEYSLFHRYCGFEYSVEEEVSL